MKFNNKKISMIHIIRRGIQLLSFLFFPGIFTTVFYSLKSVYTNILNQNISRASIGNDIIVLAVVLLVTLLLGRFFCGYLCSFGAMQDLLWFISKHTIKMKKRIPQSVDKKMKYIKYGILIFIVVVFWTIQYQLAGASFSPWNVFGMYTNISGWKSPQMLVSIGGGLLLAIIVISLMAERFFCRYLCPLGAVFALISRVRPYSLKKERRKCGACRACTNKCPMGIPLYEMDKVTSGECIQCMSCMEICPRENITASPAPAAAATVSAAAVVGAVYLGSLPVTQETDKEIVAEQQQENSTENNSAVSAGKYKDGTFTGTGGGFRGETEVSVTVNNGNIAEITVVSYADDESFFSRAKTSVISEIIKEQSVDVAGVSGATFSSNGIKEAVANALELEYTNTNDTQNSHGGHRPEGNGKHNHKIQME